MGIHAKLLATRQMMGHFEKDGKHTQGWKYFKGDVVLEQVGDALAGQGVLFLPCQADVHMSTAEEINKDGKPTTVETALIRFDMTFIDTETGETLVVPTHGSARDYGDKAIFKAQTLAIKYLFLRMFLKGEGDGDDPDAESTPPARRHTPPQERRIPSPAPKPPAPANGNGGEAEHWSRQPDPRANFDRAVTNNKIADADVKVALGSEDPAIPLDTLLMQFNNAGEAITAIIAYAKERAGS